MKEELQWCETLESGGCEAVKCHCVGLDCFTRIPNAELVHREDERPGNSKASADM